MNDNARFIRNSAFPNSCEEVEIHLGVDLDHAIAQCVFLQLKINQGGKHNANFQSSLTMEQVIALM